MNVRKPSIVTGVAGLLLLAGCATTDEFSKSELAASETNVHSLLTADTAQAAPLEAHQAEERLAQAREAIAAGDQERAMRLAKEAEVLAHLAAAKADRQRTTASRNELEESIRTLQQELNSAQDLRTQ